MAKVILNNVSKSFGKKQILKDINLEINDGEFIVLVGASGCGKSTLLRMIAGLEKIDKGTITIGEKCVNKVSAKDRDIAMVFQSYALYPHLSVQENIALGLKVRHIPKCEIKKRVSRAVEILKLEEKLNAKPKELSGGQRQRVALARAIVREPKVFLMDEPLSNLDAKLRSEMRSEIKKLHQKLKTTFIYVTHDQTEALTMGDRIVVLNEGTIQQIDTPNNIYNNPQNVFTATFMGTNPMNIVEATLEDEFLNFGDISVAISTLPYKIEKVYTPKKVILGVRSEDIVTKENPNFLFNLIKFKTKINFEENLGSTKNVYFNIQDKEFCALVGSKIYTKEEVEFSIAPKNIYLFNYETKKPLKRKEGFELV